MPCGSELDKRPVVSSLTVRTACARWIALVPVGDGCHPEAGAFPAEGPERAAQSPAICAGQFLRARLAPLLLAQPHRQLPLRLRHLVPQFLHVVLQILIIGILPQCQGIPPVGCRQIARRARPLRVQRSQRDHRLGVRVLGRRAQNLQPAVAIFLHPALPEDIILAFGHHVRSSRRSLGGARSLAQSLLALGRRAGFRVFSRLRGRIARCAIGRRAGRILRRR